MKNFTEILKNIFIKEIPKPLGRWNLDYCVVKLDKKIYLTNEDHCGPCGYTKKKEKVKEKIIDLE